MLLYKKDSKNKIRFLDITTERSLRKDTLKHNKRQLMK